MTDDPLAGLPEAPRTADNVVQLPSADLTQLFRESLPRHPSLSPQQAHMAALMHRAGRDAAAIADRIEASIGSVLDFLDRLQKAQAKQAALTDAEPEPDAPAAVDSESTEEQPAAAPERAPGDSVANVPRRRPIPTTEQRPRDTRPDVELNGLQIALIRRLRRSRISADTIARMMRLSADQVLRVAGEIP